MNINTCSTHDRRTEESLLKTHLDMNAAKERLTFLKKCKKAKVTPCSLRLRSNIKGIQKIIKKAEGKILNLKIKEKYKEIEKLKIENRKINSGVNCKVKDRIEVKNSRIKNRIALNKKIKWLKEKEYNTNVRIELNNRYSKQRIGSGRIQFKNHNIAKYLDAKLEEIGVDIKDWKVKEFEEFIGEKNKEANIELAEPVINISNKQLTTNQIRILSMGKKFALNNTLEDEQIISSVENAIWNLGENEKNILRTETIKILERRMEIKNVNNISKKELKEIKELHNDEKVIIAQADKGNAIVVMNMIDYKKKITDQLVEPDYKKMKKDKANDINKELKKELRNWEMPFNKNNIIKTCPKTPIAYGRIKIHKKDYPVRIITASISSPTKQLEIELSKYLKQYHNNKHQIRNYIDFTNKIKEIKINNSMTMYSLDIVKLYPSLPHDGLLKAVEDLLKNNNVDETHIKGIRSSLQFILRNTYLRFEDTIYKQEVGAPMGSNLSPILGEIFLSNLEARAKGTIENFPTVWYRYVDDCWLIWEKNDDEFNLFVEKLNALEKNIKFTKEKEKEREINFLDITITRNEQKLTTRVYRKPTYTGVSINKKSNHHPKQKIAGIVALIDRAQIVCQSNDTKTDEFNNIKMIAKRNGFKEDIVEKIIENREMRKNTNNNKRNSKNSNDKWATLVYEKGITDKIGKLLGKYNIRVGFKPNITLENLTSRRDLRKQENREKTGIYRVECSCGKNYTGLTERNLKNRLKEHKDATLTKQTEKSAIAEHIWGTCDGEIKWENAKIIAKEKNRHILKTREAIEIQKQVINNTSFNRKHETIDINQIWKNFLRKKPSNNQ